jgi:hypothetical protein
MTVGQHPIFTGLSYHKGVTAMKLRLFVIVGLLIAAVSVACGSGDDVDIGGFVAKHTEQPAAQTPIEHPTTPPLPTLVPANPTPVPATATQAAPTPVPPTAVRNTKPPEPARAPTQGEWIDVNVSNYTVRLMNGQSAVRTIGPVGVGREIDTGVYESTATGLYHVYSMDASLVYDAPYKTYISHWVGFDPALANGFHSFLKDKDGNVVDSSTGNVSNGCIRTGAPEAIFAFAEIGMPVWVHT